jgi:hypothetical protein
VLYICILSNKFDLKQAIRVLHIKFFLQDDESEETQTFLDYNFNDNLSDQPLNHAYAKLINYKSAAQLALLMLNEEGGAEDVETIDSQCSEPLPPCDTENDYIKLNPPKCNFMQKRHNCEEFKSFFLN